MAASDSGMRPITSGGVGRHLWLRRSGIAERRLPIATIPEADRFAAGSHSDWRRPASPTGPVATVTVCFVTTVPDIPVVRLPAIEARRLGLDGSEHVGRRRSKGPTPVPALARGSGRARRDRGDGARRCRGASPPAPRRRSRRTRGRRAPPRRREPPPQRRPSSAACSRCSPSRARSGSRSRGRAGSFSQSEAAVVRRFSFAGSSVPTSGSRTARGSSRRVPRRSAPRSSSESSEPCSSPGHLGPRASVVVSTTRPARTTPSANRVVAVRR